MTNTLTDFAGLDTAAGTDVSDSTNLDEIMTRAGLDFHVEQTELFDPEGEPIPGKRLLRREDNQHVLGVVSKRYHTISNRAMLEPFHELVQYHGAKYESAGMIGGGKKCWVSATLPSGFTVPGRTGDHIQQRIVSLFNHDGLGKNAYFSIAHRIMCNNQLRLLTNAANNSEYSFRHSKNWETYHDSASEGFRNAIDSMIQFEETVKVLNNIAMHPDEIENFMKRLYRVDMKKPTTRQRERKIEKARDLFIRGMGNVGETRWDALNAVTEMLDHHQSKRYKTPGLARRARENRFVSNNLSGYGDSIKQRALKLLVNPDNKFK